MTLIFLVLMAPWCPELGDWLAGCRPHVLNLGPCEQQVRAICLPRRP